MFGHQEGVENIDQISGSVDCKDGDQAVNTYHFDLQRGRKDLENADKILADYIRRNNPDEGRL
jgi:hypothetical protein